MRGRSPPTRPHRTWTSFARPRAACTTPLGLRTRSTAPAAATLMQARLRLARPRSQVRSSRHVTALRNLGQAVAPRPADPVGRSYWTLTLRWPACPPCGARGRRPRVVEQRRSRLTGRPRRVPRRSSTPPTSHSASRQLPLATVALAALTRPSPTPGESICDSLLARTSHHHSAVAWDPPASSPRAPYGNLDVLQVRLRPPPVRATTKPLAPPGASLEAGEKCGLGAMLIG